MRTGARLLALVAALLPCPRAWGQPAAAPLPAAPVQFALEGAVALEEGELLARITLRNTGTATATGVRLHGELTGEEAEAAAAEPLPTGQSAELVLRLPADRLTPGVHPLALLVDFAAADQPGASLSQRGWVLVYAGTAPGEAVRLTVADARLRDGAEVVARLASVDGRAHQVRVRVLPARGLSAPDAPAAVLVPARGSVETRVRLLRGGAPRPSRQGVVALAEWDEGGLHHTAAAASTVEILPDPAVLPRIRIGLAVTAGALVVAAALAEVLLISRRRRERALAAPAGEPGPSDT